MNKAYYLIKQGRSGWRLFFPELNNVEPETPQTRHPAIIIKSLKPVKNRHAATKNIILVTTECPGIACPRASWLTGIYCFL